LPTTSVGACGVRRDPGVRGARFGGHRGAAEAGAEAVAAARDAGEQDEDRRDDRDDDGQAEDDAQGVDRGRDEHGDDDADHVSFPFRRVDWGGIRFPLLVTYVTDQPWAPPCVLYRLSPSANPSTTA